MTAAQSLLRELRRKGAVVTLHGDRVRVGAPEGAITPEEREALRATKADVVFFLTQEQHFLAMSLSQFEGQTAALEVYVPWLPLTLWFVPRVEQVTVLVREGIARGRIWTAGELVDLASIPGLTRQDIVSIARVKAAFGAEIVAVHLDAEESKDA